MKCEKCDGHIVIEEVLHNRIDVVGEGSGNIEGEQVGEEILQVVGICDQCRAMYSVWQDMGGWYHVYKLLTNDDVEIVQYPLLVIKGRPMVRYEEDD